MLKFAVFDNAEHDEWTLRSAYAIGHDGAAVHSTLTHSDGFIQINLPNDESFAFSMQWDCGSMGTLTLQTCLLPQSDTPYLLSLELARHRRMFFLTKLEDWGRTDTDANAPEMLRFTQAQLKFMDALVAGRPADGKFTREHDTLARQALEYALDASELLALSTAEPNLERRLQQAAIDETSRH